MIKRSLLIAALLVFGLSACGDQPAPTPPPAATAPAPAPAPSAGVQAAATPQPPAAQSPAGALQAGLHYEVLPTPQPTETGKKIELVEFFWYACPHCNSLQAPLRDWLKRKPPDVELRRIPAVLAENWAQLARTYYAFEAMGLIDKLHHDLFAAIHEQRTLDPRFLARDPGPLFDWVAAHGVNRKQFEDTYNSPAVANRTQRAVELSRSYEVPYTPMLVVGGRFLTSPSMKGNANEDGSVNYEKFIRNLDQLIAQVRAQPRAGK